MALVSCRRTVWFVAIQMAVSSQRLSGRFCRKVAFLRPNEKIPCRKINDLRVSTFLFSVICDRTLMLPGSTTTHENGIYKATLQRICGADDLCRESPGVLCRAS